VKENNTDQLSCICTIYALSKITIHDSQDSWSTAEIWTRTSGRKSATNSTFQLVLKVFWRHFLHCHVM